MSTWILALLLTLSASSAAPAPTASSAGFMRGVVVSCPRSGQVWGSPEMSTSLRELHALGVEWVSIHPYAGVRRDGTVRWRAAAETGYLEQAVERIRAADMKLFWKPHLAYWGSFEWRGDIQFGDDPEAWERFFDGYHRFIVDQAAFAERAGAELFAVGVELERTTRFEARWRAILDDVRRVYRGRITYAANWDSLEEVPFWDAVDLIGVHAYYPLSTEADPSHESLWRGWDAPLSQLEALSSRHAGKPVVFAEIGYNRSQQAAASPWDHRMDGGEQGQALRRRLMDVALARIEREPLVVGMFWWKWIAGDWRFDRDFSLRNPEAREALRSAWATTEGGYTSR